tara:strand:- start:195 stop:509 length:315 start_codon:yes stop_codon:yes gene_type:complete
MLNEISLGISEVRSVEPEIALVTQAINSEPTATPVLQSVEVEAVAVQDCVGVAKLFNIAPQAGNLNVKPVAVIEVDVTNGTPVTFFGLSSLPKTRQGDSPFSIS